MEDKDLKGLLKTAKDVQSKEVKPNGFVYGYMNGKKEFFPLEKLVIASRNDMSIIKLVEVVEAQGEYIKRLEKELNKRIDQLGQAKVID